MPKEGFCASAFCILATFSCPGDSFQSKSHNEGYNSGIKNWGNWGTCKMDHHPRISIIFISIGKIQDYCPLEWVCPRLSSCDDEGIACLQPSAAVDGVMSVLERDKGLRIGAIAQVALGVVL